MAKIWRRQVDELVWYRQAPMSLHLLGFAPREGLDNFRTALGFDPSIRRLSQIIDSRHYPLPETRAGSPRMHASPEGHDRRGLWGRDACKARLARYRNLVLFLDELAADEVSSETTVRDTASLPFRRFQPSAGLIRI